MIHFLASRFKGEGLLLIKSRLPYLTQGDLIYFFLMWVCLIDWLSPPFGHTPFQSTPVSSPFSLIDLQQSQRALMTERLPNDHTSRGSDEGRAEDTPLMHIAPIRPNSCPLFWHLRGKIETSCCFPNREDCYIYLC